MAIPHVTFPIFIPWTNGAFGIHGSGVALRYQNRDFIVTAAHVNDGDFHTADLLVAQSPDPHSLVKLPPDSISTPMPATNNRKQDPIDLAVIPISAQMAAGLRAIGAAFIGFDNLAMPAAAPGAELVFAGYPEKQQKLYPLAEGRMYVAPEMSVVWIKQVTIDAANALGYPVDTHLVGRFRHAENRPADQGDVLDNPHGMSGGVAWLVNGHTAHFAGVVTKWDPDGNAGHLIATRSAFLPEMLNRAIMELPIPQ